MGAQSWSIPERLCYLEDSWSGMGARSWSIPQRLCYLKHSRCGMDALRWSILEWLCYFGDHFGTLREYSGSFGVTGDALGDMWESGSGFCSAFWSQGITKGFQMEVIWEPCGPLFVIRGPSVCFLVPMGRQRLQMGVIWEPFGALFVIQGPSFFKRRYSSLVTF